MNPRHGDTETERAWFSAACPECTKWITKGRSTISRFPVPLCLGLDVIQHNGRSWYWASTPNGAPRRPLAPRSWGHARCVRRYLRRTGGEDHYAIADARRRALIDHKASATAGDGAAVPRRRTGCGA